MRIGRGFVHVVAAGGLAVGGLLVAGVPAGAAASGGPGNAGHIRQVGCTYHAWWVNDSFEYPSPWGTGVWHAAYNANTHDISVSVATSTVSTVQYSISSTQSVNAGIIFTSVSASITEGISYSHSDNATFSVTITTVPPHYYGIIQGGNNYVIAVGNYDWINTQCQTETVQHVIASFPADLPPVQIAGVNTSNKPPWRQAP